MNRKGLIILLGILGAILFVSSAFAGEVQSKGGCDVVGVGTGDPLVDVPSVQAAVDQGGKILLTGTFDFGEEGSVSVLHDVGKSHGISIYESNTVAAKRTCA